MTEHPPVTCGDTCVALLTPAGRGAIATVAVVGPQAREFVDRCFSPVGGKRLSRAGPGQLLLGRWTRVGAAGDGEELIVGIVGEHAVEVHCHGGVAAVEAICGSLESVGARRVAWSKLRHWPTPVVRLGGEQGLLALGELERAALAALANATTQRTAEILLDQLNGALRQELRRLHDACRCAGQEEAMAICRSLLVTAALGLHLTTPWRITLAGPPNVGKSSLLNALVGYDRTVVFDQPGTTRDVVTAVAAIDGWPVELADTAGLRQGAETLERAGIEFAQRRLANSDLILAIADASRPATGDQLEKWFAGQPASVPIVRVWNKIDLVAEPLDSFAAAAADGLITSATTGEGVDRLLEQIGRLLVPDPPGPGAAVLFEQTHVDRLEQVLHQVLRRDWDTAAGVTAGLLEP